MWEDTGLAQTCVRSADTRMVLVLHHSPSGLLRGYTCSGLQPESVFFKIFDRAGGIWLQQHRWCGRNWEQFPCKAFEEYRDGPELCFASPAGLCAPLPAGCCVNGTLLALVSTLSCQQSRWLCLRQLPAPACPVRWLGDSSDSM